MIRKLYWSVRKLRRDFAECYHGHVAIGTGHAHSKMSFRSWCAGFDQLSGYQHVPKQRPAEFILPLADNSSSVEPFEP
jgi:hypothetical protein